MKVTTVKCLSALNAKELPTRLLILKWGENLNAKYAPIIVNERTAEQMPKLNKRLMLDRVPIDFEHNTIEGTEAFERENEPRKVAGYCTPVVVPGEGIWLDDIEWTQDGIDNFQNYADISAAVNTAKDGTVLIFRAGALCRAGATEGVKFLSAEGCDIEAELDAEDTQPPTEEQAMEALQKLIDELTKRIADLEGQIAAMKGGTDSGKAIDDAVKTMSANVAAELAKRDKEFMQRQAAAEGKVITLSAEAVQVISVKDLEDHIKTLSASVPLKQLTTTRQPANAGASLIDQYNAITDSAARSRFWVEHRKALTGKG